MLAVSICAMPMWAIKVVEYTKADEDAWKAAWCRGVQHLPPAVTPFPAGKAMPVPDALERPFWEGVPGMSLSRPLYAETPFLALEEPSPRALLTER